MPHCADALGLDPEDEDGRAVAAEGTFRGDAVPEQEPAATDYDHVHRERAASDSEDTLLDDVPAATLAATDCGRTLCRRDGVGVEVEGESERESESEGAAVRSECAARSGRGETKEVDPLCSAPSVHPETDPVLTLPLRPQTENENENENDPADSRWVRYEGPVRESLPLHTASPRDVRRV